MKKFNINAAKEFSLFLKSALVLNDRYIKSDIDSFFMPLLVKNKINFEGQEIPPYLDFKGRKHYSYYAKYNSLGFRSDEFIKDHDGLHILFAGCSETSGDGGPIEDAWSMMLYNKIKSTVKTSGFFNVSYSSCNIMDITYSIIEYINNYGSPDFIFVNYPDFNRHIGVLLKDDKLFNDDKNEYEDGWHRFMLKNYENIEDLVINKKQFKVFDYNLSFFSYQPIMLSVKLLEELCIQKGIKLVITSWHPMFHNIITDFELNFKCYYPICNFLNNLEEVYEIIKVDNNFTLEKADGHHGTAYHKMWSDNLFKVYEKIKDSQYV